MCNVDTFELSPRAIRLIASRVNGVFFGSGGGLPSSGREQSMSLIWGRRAGNRQRKPDNSTASKHQNPTEVLPSEGFDLTWTGCLLLAVSMDPLILGDAL